MQQIPSKILKEMIILTSTKSCKKIYLIGTSHQSRHSRKNVKTLIDIVKPKIVFLEL